MQLINLLAVTPSFMTAFFGTAVVCLGLVVWTILSWGEQSAVLVLAGGILYLAGTIGATVARNVPLNNGLAAPHLRASRLRIAGTSMSGGGPHGTICES